ncbi:phospholipase D-like domain-containing protein, partial [Enterocloster citroniae]
MEDVQNARKSIKIISPFLSPSLISELINARNRGLQVQLITVDKIEDYGDTSNIYKLIRQHRLVDEEAQDMRRRWKKIADILLIGIIILTVITAALPIFLKDIPMLWGIIPVLIMSLIYYFYKKSINQKRIYYYTYSQLFPFKVYMSPDKHAQSNT